MFKLICQKTHHLRPSAARASPSHNLCFNRTHPFSSSLTSVDTSPDQHSLTVNFYTNSCGFSLEKAISASKYVRFETLDKPNSVLAFFKNHGFTQTQISSLLRKFPRVLVYDTEKTLLPKIEFLKSKGVLSSDITRILSTSPNVLGRSLENTIIPYFDFFRKFLQSEEKAIRAIERCGKNFSVDRQTQVPPNIEILLEAGVPNANIMVLLMRQPNVFMTSSNRFREVVEDVKKMCFNPLEIKFLIAVHALRAMTKSTWEKKVDVFKKWGWTEDDILGAFKYHPWCMMASENKIFRVMDFFVNEMGWESSLVARRPILVSQSLEKKTIPRIAVYQALLSKGLIKASNIRLVSFLTTSETMFIKRFLSCHKEEGPGLLKMYEDKRLTG